ncbi:unnamed protein product [Urochloa humidicola]
MEMLRRRSAAEAGEGSAKKIKMEKPSVGNEAPPVPGPPAAKMKKKTKTVVKTVSDDHVQFVLASKPMPRRRPHPGPMSEDEDLRRSSALLNKVVNARNDLLRSLQSQFRNDLNTKGRVEVEAEVTDDES